MKPGSPHHLFLTGFMASGKSTVGRLLASSLQNEFVDLDCSIERSAGKRIYEIFQERGEEGFRDLETEALTKLPCHERLVIALGGGTLIRESNRQRISEDGTLIYLQSSLENLTKRIASDERIRPLARSEDLRALLETRKQYYEMATIQINTDGKTPPRIAEEISLRLKEEFS